MAKSVLPVDFQDDILNSSMEGRRRYTQVTNTDGTVSLVDSTQYDQVGSAFGAGQLNATNKAVNESVDQAKIIQSLDDIAATSQAGYVPDALAVKELNNNLGGASFEIQEDGAYIRYTPPGGADPVLKKLGSGPYKVYARWVNYNPRPIFLRGTLQLFINDVCVYEGWFENSSSYNTISTSNVVEVD